VNPGQFATYIKLQLEQGMTRDGIAAHLAAAGWSPEEIKRAFDEFDGLWTVAPSNTPLSPNPIVVPQNVVPRSRHHPVRTTFLIIGILAVLFGIYSLLFNSGIIGPGFYYLTEDEGTFDPYLNAIEPIASPVATSSASAITPQPAVTSNTISEAEKNDLVLAILTRDSILRSDNADSIRGYLRVSASTADAARYEAMTDSEILALADQLLVNSEHVTAEALLSSQAVWRRVSANEVRVTLIIPGGTVNRIARLVSGVWY
jgi:hypothetical protein